MEKIASPCMTCLEHNETCHCTCIDYINWKESRDKQKLSAQEYFARFGGGKAIASGKMRKMMEV